MLKIFSTFGMKFYSMNRLYLLIIPISIFCLVSCEKENISSDPSLNITFSTDTVMFDTVFTAIGSSTQHFMIYNSNSYDLKISQIKLAGGASSFFRLNVDGVAADIVNDITIRRKDSLYVFVDVTVDPTNLSSPLVVTDSIIFTTNGNVQDVKLVAWGQDVHLFNADSIQSNTIFTNDKPYLVYNYLRVKPNVELKILAGAKLYFHNNAYLVVQGTLSVEGDYANPVVFEGDRLEMFYRDKAGQWGGVWLMAGSRNSQIKWAQIRNAINGLIVDTCYTPALPTLKISNSVVENMSSIGLYARGSKIEADNCLFSNAGQVSVALTMGGDYKFYQCTIANYWGQYIYRKGPALLLNNYYLYEKNGVIQVAARDLVGASFSNCIIYGSRDQEVEVDNSYKGQPVAASMVYYFDHCALKVSSDFSLTDPTKYKNVIKDNPKFKDPWKLNFQLDTLSPAKDKGLFNIATLYPIDLKNFSHLMDAGPDLGAFERKE